MRLFMYGLLAAIRPDVEPPKLCTQCKFYRKGFWNDKKFGKCSLFPKEDYLGYSFVDGSIDYDNDYQYCATARTSESMCGKSGTLFEPIKR